jgi:AraC family transcriptional regulator, positive regulator of tynA and feaB
VMVRLAHQPDLRVEMVAAAAGVSVRQLYRLFDAAGESYAEHLATLRVAAVTRVVAETLGQSRTLTEVAHACGFNDLSTFNRTFRRLQGLTPSEYRAGLMARQLQPGD